MDARQVMMAAFFAAKKHRHQRRKDAARTPYINHPIEVAILLLTVGGVTDIDVLVAAILHDTVEDTDTSVQEISELFGERVVQTVLEVSDDKILPQAERKRRQIANASHKSHAAKLVKLADKLSNLKSTLDPETAPENWSHDRRVGYCAWAWCVVEGLRGTNAALESELDRVFAQVPELADKSAGEIAAISHAYIVELNEGNKNL